MFQDATETNPTLSIPGKGMLGPRRLSAGSVNLIKLQHDEFFVNAALIPLFPPPLHHGGSAIHGFHPHQLAPPTCDNSLRLIRNLELQTRGILFFEDLGQIPKSNLRSGSLGILVRVDNDQAFMLVHGLTEYLRHSILPSR